jgi:hypothetical protein
MLVMMRLTATVFNSMVTSCNFKSQMRHSNLASDTHGLFSTRDVLRHNDKVAQAPDLALTRSDLHPISVMHS